MLNRTEYKRVSECTMAGSLTMNCSLLVCMGAKYLHNCIMQMSVSKWTQSICSTKNCYLSEDTFCMIYCQYAPHLVRNMKSSMDWMCQTECSTVFSAIQFNCMWFGDCFQLKTQIQTICYLRCVAYNGTNFAISILLFATFNWNYIPLCSDRGIFAIPEPSSHSMCFCVNIYLKFRKQKDFEWSITVSVLHFKAVGNEAATAVSKANVTGAKNSNRITMMKFRGCTTALADNNYIL